MLNVWGGRQPESGAFVVKPDLVKDFLFDFEEGEASVAKLWKSKTVSAISLCIADTSEVLKFFSRVNTRCLQELVAKVPKWTNGSAYLSDAEAWKLMSTDKSPKFRLVEDFIEATKNSSLCDQYGKKVSWSFLRPNHQVKSMLVSYEGVVIAPDQWEAVWSIKELRLISDTISMCHAARYEECEQLQVFCSTGDDESQASGCTTRESTEILTDPDDKDGEDDEEEAAPEFDFGAGKKS